MAIRKRSRTVKWSNGYPSVTVGGEDRVVRNVIQKGSDNPKTDKNNGQEFLAVGTTLSPAKSSGVGNVCAHAGNCADTCLDMTGNGAKHYGGNIFNMIHGARIARTVVWYKARDWFLSQQKSELDAWLAKARAQGKSLCYRPNMLSDVPWEKFGVPQGSPGVQFYDYTKDPRRVGQICDNYWVTFSRDGSKDDGLCIELLQEGKNVAIVFDDGYTTGARNLHGSGPTKMPEEWNGFPVFNGDVSDRRWEDPRGHVIGLILKAPSMQFRQAAINSGFAVISK